MRLIKFDDKTQSIYAEWRAGQQLSASDLLTYPLADPPPSARTASPETLWLNRYYQIGYSQPVDAGHIGGDTQSGPAWTRRWAAWHEDDEFRGWRVAQVTVVRLDQRLDNAMVNPSAAPTVDVRWDFVECPALRDVFGEADEDGYTDALDDVDGTPASTATDAQLRDLVAAITADEATGRACDWWESR